MEVNMKASGRMTNNMVMVRRFGIMVLRFTLEISMRGKSMEGESLFGVMDHFMKESSRMDCSMDLEFTILRRMRRHILDSLLREKLKGRGRWCGKMEGVIMDSLKMGKRMGKGHLDGLMEILILENLLMGR
jgi:hypothetical protein